MKDRSVRVTVPQRIDIGGTWDLKAFALLYRHLSPLTVNIALDLPTTLTFTRRPDDRIEITDAYDETITDLSGCDLGSRFGLLLAISTHLRYSGFSLSVGYTIPPRNGLGGSGALAAGFILGMKHLYPDPNTEYADIARMVHEVEESLRFSFCGMQDQCAALYGGVNEWSWTYGGDEQYARRPLLPKDKCGEIGKRLLVAYLGRPHGADVNSRQVASLFNPRTRPKWFRINEITREAADAIAKLDFVTLAACISEENAIRLSIVPERLALEAEPLMKAANLVQAGFGVAGAGAGGCVFALCPGSNSVGSLGRAWRKQLADIPSALVIERPEISHGIQIQWAGNTRAVYGG